MLQILEQQMQAFQDAQFRQFENKLVCHLKESFDSVLLQHQIDDAHLCRIIRQGIERGKHYRIVNEYDVTRFIEYAFEYGAGFESLPWVSPVLNASHLSGEEKMDRLDAVSTFNLRQPS